MSWFIKTNTKPVCGPTLQYIGIPLPWKIGLLKWNKVFNIAKNIKCQWSDNQTTMGDDSSTTKYK